MPESINNFEGGMQRSQNPRSVKGNILFDSENGSLYYDYDGNTMWRPIHGNKKALVFDGDALDPDTDPLAAVDSGNGALHVPIGGCSFADCLIIVTCRPDTPVDNMVIWLFQFNEEDEAYGQVIISDITYPLLEKFQQQMHNSIRMRPLFENEELYRIQWCDGVEGDSNPLRSLTFGKTGTVTNPTYNGATVTGTFNVFQKSDNTIPSSTNNMSPFQMGVIHFEKRVNGNIWSGRYTYMYRLIRDDGYRTPWSHPTNEVFVTTDIIDADSSDNMHLFEMEESGTPSTIGNRVFVKGVDQTYSFIEFAYVYIPDATNVPTIAASFDFVEITGDYHFADHISMEGESLNVAEIISTRLNIRAAQTLEIKDEHLWVGNFKTGQLEFTEAEIEDVLQNVEAVHIFREMSVDKLGKTDKAWVGQNPRKQLYHVPPITGTTTLQMNDVDDLVLPIENDFPIYRGQQVDNSYVGYWRDETYRFGIVFYDREGNPGFVYHLCDYKFPKMYEGDDVSDVSAERITQAGAVVDILDSTDFALHKKAWLSTNQADEETISNYTSYPSILQRPVKDGDSSLTDQLQYGNPTQGYMLETYLRLQGIKFDGIDVSGIKDRISGFAIVRCKAEETILAQGIISPCVIYEGDEKIVKPTPRPHMTIRWIVNAWPHTTDVRPTVAHNNNFRPQRSDAALWDRCKPADPDSESPRLRYVDDFATAYIPEVMFDQANLPSYDSDNFLELVQICWEEYNCGLDVYNTAYDTQVSFLYNQGSDGYNSSFSGLGPQLCNMFHRDPRNSGNRWTSTEKMSWHLMFNTRLQDFYTPASGYSIGFKHDDPSFSNGDQMLVGHPMTGEYSGGGGASLRWAYPREMFPLYGDTLKPEYMSLYAANEKRETISLDEPDWKFHNHTKYWSSAFKQTSTGVYNNQWRFDDYYGGNQDVSLHNTHSNGVLFDTSTEDNQREITGHDRTLLIKYNAEVFRGNVAGPAKFLFCGVIPTWAEMLLGGPTDFVGKAYTCDPNIGAAARWIFNWKHALSSVYGGQSLTALQNNIFIGTGHFQPVNNTSFNTPTGDIYNGIEVWGGNCWLDAHSGAIGYPSYNNPPTNGGGRNNASFAPFPSPLEMTDDPSSVVGNQLVTLPEHSAGGHIMVFPHESKYNLCLRSSPSAGNPNSAYVGLQPMYIATGYGGYSRWAGGLHRTDGKSGDNPDAGGHYMEEFFINEVLRYDDNLRPFIATPRGFRGVDHFPLRWTYSGGGKKTYGDLVDVFREFYVNNWRDINGSYGEIKASTFFKNDIYSYQVKAYSRLRIYERSLLETQNQDSIVTGEGDVISGAQYISQTIGCQHPESLKSTPKAMYWVDAQARSIYMSDGKAESNLSDVKGFNQILRQLLWRYVDGHSIYGSKGVSIHTAYDPDRNQLEFHFPALYADALSDNGSKRYDFTSLLSSAGTVYGQPHRLSEIEFVDKESEAVPVLSPPTNILQIQEQDIWILSNDLVPAGVPFSMDFLLYQGLYGSQLSPKKNLTIREFYIAIPSRDDGWIVNFKNHKATSPTLATPDVVYPDQSSSTEIEGYRYVSSNYPHTVDQAIVHNQDYAVFHLYRPSEDGRFQVRLIKDVDGKGLIQGLSIRGALIYNEDIETFVRWESNPSSFTVNHRSKMFNATESGIADGLFLKNEHVSDFPTIYGAAFNSWLTHLVNQIGIANKIFDNYRLNTNDKDDIFSLRFNTKTQAIVLFVENDERIKLKRDILRSPIRRISQQERMRGEYLMIDVEMVSQTHKLAYCFSSRTLYRISHKN